MILARLLSSLRHSERGAIAIELLGVVLMFGAAASFSTTAFGYYKSQSRDAKAAYAVADAISRETQNITPAFLDTLHELHKFTTVAKAGSALRITVVDYDPRTADYRIRWSRSRAEGLQLNSDVLTVDELRPRLPTLANYESIVVVETYLNHEPFSGHFGMAPILFQHVAISRPRNGPQICVTDSSDRTTINRRC